MYLDLDIYRTALPDCSVVQHSIIKNFHKVINLFIFSTLSRFSHPRKARPTHRGHAGSAKEEMERESTLGTIVPSVTFRCAT
jgi:hypothetical protein